MKNAKLWIVFSFLIVFVAGVAGGILFENYYSAKKRHRPDRKTAQARPPTMEILAEELQLSEDQKNRIEELFKQNEAEFRELRTHMRTRLSEMRKELDVSIKAVLNEEQVKKYEAMVEKYLAERQRQSEERRRRSDRPAEKK